MLAPWPHGEGVAAEIGLEASGFERHLSGRKLLVDRQWLIPSERGAV
jgi:hypothetical protein